MAAVTAVSHGASAPSLRARHVPTALALSVLRRIAVGARSSSKGHGRTGRSRPEGSPGGDLARRVRGL